MAEMPVPPPFSNSSSRALFALADCNNFYASCERVFAPHLRNAPVVVLSNNDGCVIARSQEAKDLGIKMGEPAFKREAYFARHGVHIFSSNYALYGDMSARVMRTLGEFTPDMEVYSIDEAFLRLDGVTDDATACCRRIRDTVLQWTGMPISIGVGPTKTLAKIANRFAKKTPRLEGVLDLATVPNLDALLEQVDVGDVWGVGRRYTRMLGVQGIRNARQLRDAPAHWIRRRMTVNGLATVLELRGTPCFDLDRVPPPKKSILCSRSFGRAVSTEREMREAVAAYTARAMEKLRAQGSVASIISVFLMTNPHKDCPQYKNIDSARLAVATDHTPTAIGAAHGCLERIFRSGYVYKKAGVMLMGLETGDSRQLSLLNLPPNKDGEQAALMRALDAVNAKWGRDTLQVAAAGLGRPWKMRQLRKSPRYTTAWSELPVVRA